jgi:transcriptional regulator with XRE-family HTH domain
MARKPKRLKLTDQIRKALAECGETRYRICKNTGLAPAALCRFQSGERGLSTESLDTLAEYLGLSIISTKEPANRK